jgi:hypothetical protein
MNKETGRISPKKQDIKVIWNSKEITNPENVADLFNAYYCKITEELLKKNGNNMPKSGNQYLKIQESTKTMSLFPVTEREVEKVAKGLKNKLSAGIDEIPDYVVKQCIKQLKKLLANIYNASLESGIFPDQQKVAKVIPVYKKGEKKDIQNYRPIALLSVFSKLLEKLVHNRLMAFIEGNGVITEAQHGFRMMKSTETAMQTFIQSTQEAIEKKVNPIGIFFDLTKAYDVLNHKVLLSKLLLRYKRRSKLMV